MPMYSRGTDALMREILKMKGVDFEIDDLSLQSFVGRSPQILSSVNYSWNKKQFNRRLVISRRVLHSPI